MKEGYRPHLESVESVLAETGSEAKGLSSAEAAARLEANGPNKLIEAKKKSSIARVFDQLKDAMIILLLAAAARSLITSL